MPVNDPIKKYFPRLSPIQEKGLAKLGIKTVRDLLYHFPARYSEALTEKAVRELVVGEQVTIYGRVVKNTLKKAWRKKIPIAEMIVEDHTGRIKAVWYHQAYMAKKAFEGSFVKLSGKVTDRKGDIYIANPELAPIDAATLDKETLFGKPMEPEVELQGSRSSKPEDKLTATYPESRGVSSNWIEHAIKKLISLNLHAEIPDPIPPTILKKYNLPSLTTALVWVHQPQKIKDSEAARKRFAFEEIFFIQLDRQRHKQNYQASKTFNIKTSQAEVQEFLDRFPFKPTGAQTKAIKEILADFKKGPPMTRLLEGDVGSGKTLVAAATAFSVVRNNLQVAYMAPTEILARQHFASFIEYFSHLNISIALITGKECLKFPSKISVGDNKQATHISRNQLLKWVENGEIDIVIGTHALIQKSVQFKKLAYVIIDEQHRFGVMQRSKLTKKNQAEVQTLGVGTPKHPVLKTSVPHLLSMTATPIPRTLALTIYGDLDLTLLDELPAGRKPIITEIVSEKDATKIYEKIKTEITAGRQAYVICPRIEEPDPDKEMALQAKSAVAEQKKLGEEIFPDFMVGLLHSKMKPDEKEDQMADFVSGDTDILVATSVVEVGVNVPNSTIIIIEGAERFGLAQLHQLRGRVLRSSHQAYCYLVSKNKSGISMDRLKALVNAKNGFELAEHDLKLRGAGSLAHGKQWGISDIGMEAIKNIKMVEAARNEATDLLTADPLLKNYPLIEVRLRTNEKQIHFE